MKLRSNLHGIGRHSLDEIAEFSFQDLEALSTLLGDKPYFNGDTPSTIGENILSYLKIFKLSSQMKVSLNSLNGNTKTT